MQRNRTCGVLLNTAKGLQRNKQNKEFQGNNVLIAAREYKERNYEELQALGLGFELGLGLGARVRDGVKKRRASINVAEFL